MVNLRPFEAGRKCCLKEAFLPVYARSRALAQSARTQISRQHEFNRENNNFAHTPWRTGTAGLDKSQA